MGLAPLSDDPVQLMRVPGERHIGEQGQRPRLGDPLLGPSAALSYRAPVMDRALQRMHRFPVTEDTQHLAAERRLREIVAEVNAADELAQNDTGLIERIATRGGAITA